MLPKRSKARLTKAGMLYEQRIAALRRIQARQYPTIEARPTRLQTQESMQRWDDLKHKL